MECKKLFWNKYSIENTEEAKKDKDWLIRHEAELFFEIKKAKEELAKNNGE